MFTYYFVILAVPFGLAERRLLDGLTGLHGLAGVAYREGEDLRARIGPGIDRKLIAKTVRLETGTPRRSDTDTSIPFTWEATGARVLFPRMEGELVLAAMGADLSQLLFRGTYRPPLGSLGNAVDRMMLHRVAETSVRDFVERIACSLTEDVPDVPRSIGSVPGQI